MQTLRIVLTLSHFIYQLFWTQACPEGMCTNGTHRSHVRCHPYNTGVYDPYSFRIVM